jgi:membrane protein
MKKNIIRSFWECLGKSAVNTVNHDGIEHAGYMAFLFILSLFPFFVFFVAFAGFVGDSAIGEHFLQYVLASLPHNISKALEPRIVEIISGPPQGLLTLAIVGAIWTASSSVEGLRTILNRVYHVKAPPHYIWRRLLSIGQFLTLVSIIVASTFLLLVLPIIWQKIPYLHQISDSLLNLLNLTGFLKPFYGYFRYVLVSITLFLVVSTLYFIIPNTKLRWYYVFPGSLLVIILWFIAGLGLSLYIDNFQQVGLIYGSLQGVIVSLLFFYIINMIFIYGAEFNYIFGSEIKKRIRH